jgi:hypothetical protein
MVKATLSMNHSSPSRGRRQLLYLWFAMIPDVPDSFYLSNHKTSNVLHYITGTEEKQLCIGAIEIHHGCNRGQRAYWPVHYALCMESPEGQPAAQVEYISDVCSFLGMDCMSLCYNEVTLLWHLPSACCMRHARRLGRQAWTPSSVSGRVVPHGPS